jgi:hypothetical protein
MWGTRLINERIDQLQALRPVVSDHSRNLTGQHGTNNSSQNLHLSRTTFRLQNQRWTALGAAKILAPCSELPPARVLRQIVSRTLYYASNAAMTGRSCSSPWRRVPPWVSGREQVTIRSGVTCGNRYTYDDHSYKRLCEVLRPEMRRIFVWAAGLVTSKHTETIWSSSGNTLVLVAVGTLE